MTMTVKVLGQVEPSATTDTTLYTVPTGKGTVVSTLSVCNKSSSAVTFRVAVRPDGETLADKHYLAYEASLPAYEAVYLTLGLTLAADDVVTVRASAVDVAFHAYGDESDA